MKTIKHQNTVRFTDKSLREVELILLQFPNLNSVNAVVNCAVEHFRANLDRIGKDWDRIQELETIVRYLEGKHPSKKKNNALPGQLPLVCP